MEQAGIRSKFVPTVTAALALLATFTPGAAAHPVPPLPGQPEVRFCAIDQTHIPHWRDERDARITSQARAEIIAYAGNKGKWWFPLTKRSDGKTVRDLHPGVKVLQYLTPSGFNAVPTPGDPIDPPSGPTGYAHTRTLTVAEYARVARATGERVPEIRDLKPYGFPDAIAEPQWGPLMVHANPAGKAFLAYAVRYARTIRKAGGDGVFMDGPTGTFGFLAGMKQTGMPVRLPPYCFRMRGGGYYWERVKKGLPVPSLADLKAGKHDALAQVASVANCRATGAPVEWPAVEDLARAEMGLLREIKASGAGMVIVNALHVLQADLALKFLGVVDGAMMEGFVEGQRPEAVEANLALAARAARTGKWIWLKDKGATKETARYSYAAYLLVAAPNVCWGVGTDVVTLPDMDVVLGQARGGYQVLPLSESRADHVVYHRRFEHGEVFLNPQDRPMSIRGGTIPAKSGLVRPLGLADAH